MIQATSLLENTLTTVRKAGTSVTGEPFDEETVELVWRKAQEDIGYHMFRKDCCGATILRTAHGKTCSVGWEIDHIVPVSRGGKDDLDNLQPLHWENNRQKGDEFPRWVCKITI